MLLEQIAGSFLIFGFGGMFLYMGIQWLDWADREFGGIDRDDMFLGGMLTFFGAIFIIPGVMRLVQ